MDFSESTKVVFNRIQNLDPENFIKIIGYLLFNNPGEREMVRLSLGSDALIHQVICKAKAELQKFPLTPNAASSPISSALNLTPFTVLPSQFNPCLPIPSRSTFSPPAFRVPTKYCDPQLDTMHNSEIAPPGYLESICELQNQTQFLRLDDQIEPANPRTVPGLASLPEVTVKTCHYFNMGFCKHGNSCRFYHEALAPDSKDSVNEDQTLKPGSLEKLELEIVDILKSRRGNPVTIASLPLIYYEKYGKVLQADGYLTESQRHGKAGYSLTKLLARLKGSIRLIDSYRPHGQHAVILAEDAPKYMENLNERSDPGPIVSGSRQIYLTFPAESKFSEVDVSDYFNAFGPVEDVRIPFQHKRMFGFVTFVSADTVNTILANRNPHFVCGARVLVKPYREKSKLIDRKYLQRIEHPAYYSPNYIDVDYDLHSTPRGCVASHLLRKHLMAEQEHAMEIERRRLAELQLAQKPMANQYHYTDEITEERFSYLLNVLDSDSTSDDKIRHADTTYTNG